MIFFISIFVILATVFWLTMGMPWLKRRRKPKPKIGDFERFVFPIIRRSWPSLISQQLVSVQPMTGPVDLFQEEEELHTVLDDIVDALIASETDPEWIAEEIVRGVFKTCPYSKYYPVSKSAAV